MSGDNCIERPLFGGAISGRFPLRFEDVSNIRQVPDNQEVFVDAGRDESLFFELLEIKHDVDDGGSATWFLRDLANEQDGGDTLVLEHCSAPELVGLSCRNTPVIMTTAVGQMAVSKARQGWEARNLVRVYVANLRLKEVSTDVLVIAYEPLIINQLSETARAVRAGPAIPAAQSGFLPLAEVFKHALTSFKVHDWNLFGPQA